MRKAVNSKDLPQWGLDARQKAGKRLFGLTTHVDKTFAQLTQEDKDALLKHVLVRLGLIKDD
jgi:hypothetical protein